MKTSMRGARFISSCLRPLATIVVAGLFALLPAPSTGAERRSSIESAGPAGTEDYNLRRQLWLVPSSVPKLLMHAHLFRPKGDGPFPLAVINHGSDEDARQRSAEAMPDYPALTAWLVARGYAVLVPQRPGHGQTGGTYLESQGWCGSPDYIGAGIGTAKSIAAAIAFMRQEKFIRPKGTVVLGNSAGGWGALALASLNPSGVAAIVNFSGGRGGRDRNLPDHNCAPDRLVSAAGSFGSTARVPTLWLYAENDTYFTPALSKRMADAYSAGGGKAEYHLLGPVRGDGHALINTSGNEASWVPYLSKFLTAAAAK